MGPELAFKILAKPIQEILPDLGLRAPTQSQALAILPMVRKKNLLLVAPTASGKTEAALLPVLSRYLTKGQKKGIAILFVSPLRTLNRDLLNRITRLSSSLGIRYEVCMRIEANQVTWRVRGELHLMADSLTVVWNLWCLDVSYDPV